MVLCAVATCNNKTGAVVDGQVFSFWCVPAMKEYPKKRPGAEYERACRKIDISRLMREKWIDACCRVFKADGELSAGQVAEHYWAKKSTRICSVHFHNTVLTENLIASTTLSSTSDPVHTSERSAGGQPSAVLSDNPQTIAARTKINYAIGACPTLYLRPYTVNGKHIIEERSRVRSVITFEEMYQLEPSIGHSRKLIAVDAANERARKRACIAEEVNLAKRQAEDRLDKISDFEELISMMPKLHKQWFIIESSETSRLILNRYLYSESSFIPILQNVHITPSENGVDVSVYTPSHAVTSPTCFGKDQHFIQSISFVETRLSTVDTYSGLLAHIQHIEATTDAAIPSGDAVHTYESVCSILRERATYLSESPTEKNKSTFYSYTAELVEMMETNRHKRRYPQNSYVLANAHSIATKAPGQYEYIRDHSLFTFLPDKRTLFSQLNSNALPPDCIFAGTGSAHAAILSCIVDSRIECQTRELKTQRGVSKDILKREQIKWIPKVDSKSKIRNSLFIIHVDEINIRPMYNFANKSGFYGPAHNNPDQLAYSIQTFFMTTASGSRLSLNLLSKPVARQTGEELCEYTIVAVEKAKETGAIIGPIIFDGCAVNRKALRLLLYRNTPVYQEAAGRRLALPQQILPESVDMFGFKLFPMYCLVHIVKCIRNNMIRPKHIFRYPEMRLSTGYQLPAGICDIQHIRRLYTMYKDKLFSPIRIKRITVWPSNLERQQVAPALLLFTPELSMALRREFPVEAKGTYLFLEMIHDFIIEPFLTVSVSKGRNKRRPRAEPFSNSSDPRLVEAEEIATWLQKSWYASITDIPQAEIDEEEPVDDINFICHELLGLSLNDTAEEENPNEIDDAADGLNDGDTTNDAPVTKRKAGNKPLADGLSPETFHTLSHTLRTMAACIRYMLDVLCVLYVLPGRLNNDPIELSFCISRAMAGGNRHLDVVAYVYAQRTLLVRAIFDVCRNEDGSHNRETYKKIFHGLQAKTDLLENKQMEVLGRKWESLRHYGPKLAYISVKDQTMPYIAGSVVFKLLKNNNITCLACVDTVSMGKGLEDDDALTLDYNSSLVAELDRKGLTWASTLVVVLAGLILDVVDVIVNDKLKLKQFHQSACSSRVGLRALKLFMLLRVDTCSMIQSLCIDCELCCANRKEDLLKPMVNTLYNIAANNMTIVLNRKAVATVVTLSMVKANKKANKPTSLTTVEGTSYR